MPPRSEYEQRLEARQQAHKQLRRQDDHVVSFRTAVFFAGAILAWVVWGGWGVPWQCLLIPIAMFIGAVVYHEAIARKQRAARRAIEYYERCLARLDGKWSGVGPTGEQFSDPLHPYSGDVDIFGEGSLFQLLNSPVTPGGEKTLAAWLAPDPQVGPPPRETVLQRQQAVKTLCDQVELREQLAIIGPTEQSQRDARELHSWLSDSGGLTAPWIRIVGTILGLAGTFGLYQFFTSGSLATLIFVLFIQMGFLYRIRKPLLAIMEHSERAVFELRRVVKVVSALETVTGEDTTIQRLRNELIENNEKASDHIHKLERLVSQFENIRNNAIFAPLAIITMLGLYFTYSIDRWRTAHGTHVERWFETAGELEALLAFSQLHFENPEYCFPALVEAASTSGKSKKQVPTFVATKIAHPLLPTGTAIANDVELNDDCQLLLVSGSNMSGKSTLLRSVGINAALAWAGAVVCARELKLARLQVTAAMRIQDSLQTGTSHFFAELKRIQLVVELAKQNSTDAAPVMFLLDEILHGTNSHDRLVGARGVIDSLLKTGAVGLVTTHDLALSEIVTKLDTPSRNVHFRDEWIEGKMTFDYQMREGVVPKSNALSLMRLLGLDV